VRVDQLAPECRYAGKFLVRGRAGRNVVRFRGRLKGRPLRPGTYRLVAHPRGERRLRLERVTVVVLDRPPGGAAEVRAARARNECPAGVSPSQIEFVSARATAEPEATKGVESASSAGRRSGLLEADGPIARPLGNTAETLVEAARRIPLSLYAMAAVAVLLLAVASMPQFGGSSRAGAMLVQKRASLAAAGGAFLLTAIVTYVVLVAL
jgi:hypothetical protein